MMCLPRLSCFKLGWIYCLVLLPLSVAAVNPLESNEPITPIPLAELSNPELVALGRELFQERRLSADGTVACSNCHLLQNYGVDSLPVSVGIGGQKGERNAPSIFNSGLLYRLFWDGRAASLEEQIDGPILNPKEMGNNWRTILLTLEQDEYYRGQFNRLFADQGGVTAANVRHAIATFERSLNTANSPFDRYLKGEDGAISSEAKQGYQLFKRYGCSSCHQGRLVGGNLFEKLGIYSDESDTVLNNLRGNDFGRYTLTRDPEQRYEFRVPSLRNINQTAPYFHNGSVPTLTEAVAIMARYQLGRILTPHEIELIIAFLNTLTAPLSPL